MPRCFPRALRPGAQRRKKGARRCLDGAPRRKLVLARLKKAARRRRNVASRRKEDAQRRGRDPPRRRRGPSRRGEDVRLRKGGAPRCKSLARHPRNVHLRCLKGPELTLDDPPRCKAGELQRVADDSRRGLCGYQADEPRFCDLGFQRGGRTPAAARGPKCGNAERWTPGKGSARIPANFRFLEALLPTCLETCPTPVILLSHPMSKNGS